MRVRAWVGQQLVFLIECLGRLQGRLGAQPVAPVCRALQRRQVKEKRLGVVGMMYDVVRGEVQVIDETRHGV